MMTEAMSENQDIIAPVKKTVRKEAEKTNWDRRGKVVETG